MTDRQYYRTPTYNPVAFGLGLAFGLTLATAQAAITLLSNNNNV